MSHCKSAREERCAERFHDTTSEPSSVTWASSVEFSGQVVGRFQRDVPDERATHGRQERVRPSYIHRCVEDGEQRARAEDLWCQTFRWDVQSAGSAAQRPKDDLHARDWEGM